MSEYKKTCNCKTSQTTTVRSSGTSVGKWSNITGEKRPMKYSVFEKYGVSFYHSFNKHNLNEVKAVNDLPWSKLGGNRLSYSSPNKTCKKPGKKMPI